MIKFSKKHPILFSLFICAVTLLISASTTWAEKPVMGVDKLIGDSLITFFCLIVIKRIGIWDTAGFRKNGFGKGILCLWRKSMKSKAEGIMIIITVVSTIMTLIYISLYTYIKSDIWFSLSITFGTIAYQLFMRLVVGWSVNLGIKKRLNYNNTWFKQKDIEAKLFKALRVREWKNKLPTYIPENFNMSNSSLQVIIQNMCIAELGHELMIAASYFSLIFSLLTNDWKKYIWIFIITSSFAATGDMLFVIVQRYNRPRVVSILNRKNSGNRRKVTDKNY